MPTTQQLKVSNLDRHQSFTFRCGSGLPCFTDCCRQLELALTPYDVLRLSRALNTSGAAFLEHHGVVEKADNDAFPQVFLGMIDDGRASCPWVTPEGCTVYSNRPGACRTYPLGRGSRLAADNRADDFYVLIHEAHCYGFTEDSSQTVASWLDNQELDLYNEFNDLTMQILQHPRIRQGFRPDGGQQERFLDVLYRLDGFASPVGSSAEQRLKQGLALLEDELFGP